MTVCPIQCKGGLALVRFLGACFVGALLYAVLSHLSRSVPAAVKVGLNVHTRPTRRPRDRLKLLIDTPGCRIPYFDALDSDLLASLSRPAATDCNGSHAYTYVDRTFLRVNTTIGSQAYFDKIR